MPTLADTLQAFATRVWNDAADEADHGYAVYRRNLRGNFADVLALEFPAVQRLVGDAMFRALARRFQQSHPSTSGNAHGIGAPFAAWLRTRAELASVDWIADVAALEWAWEDAAVAADAQADVDIAAFAALSPEQQSAVRARLHPALRIVSSPAPIHAIWRDNLPDEHGRIAALDADYGLSLAGGGEAVLVERVGQTIATSVVPRGEALWLAALADGVTLGDAIDIAMSAAPDFDLGSALATALRRTRIIALY